MGKKVNITAPLGVSEIILRKGTALEAKAPKSIKIDGILASPHQFLTGKPTMASLVEDIHLLIMKDKGRLELHVKDTDPYTEHVISGQLTRDKAMDLFKINTDKRWTVQEFLKFIRTVKYYFASGDEQKALIESLQKWSAKVEIVINEHQSTTGNSMSMLEKKVGGIELKTKFKLNVPIYQGYDKKQFDVEIGFDPKSNAVDLYLISDELFELEASLREKLVDDEIAKFEKYAFSKIQVS